MSKLQKRCHSEASSFNPPKNLVKSSKAILTLLWPGYNLRCYFAAHILEKKARLNDCSHVIDHHFTAIRSTCRPKESPQMMHRARHSLPMLSFLVLDAIYIYAGQLFNIPSNAGYCSEMLSHQESASIIITTVDAESRAACWPLCSSAIYMRVGVQET